MKKLKLNPDHLSVESFATPVSTDPFRGTVLGNRTRTFDCQFTGILYPTCDTCPNPTIEEPGCA